MKIAQKIERKINKMPAGTTFKYQQLPITAIEYSAAAKSIERLLGQGIIKRVSKGVFYKPKQTAFGEIRPNEEELLKPYLYENKKRVAYITGTALYNRMGLTTQVPKSIKIACRGKRIYATVGNIKATPTKSYVDVTDKNFYLLETLDAIKDFKKIPDLDSKSAITVLLKRIDSLSLKEVKLLIKFALSYPPRVRAFLGALLEKNNNKSEIELLQKSLNPLSEYDYRINSKLLSTAPNWNII